MNNKSIVYVALFAAIAAALGLFPPIPLVGTSVPITAQSMAPMLAGAILGGKRGLLSQVLFLILIAIGLPLLPGGRGGFGVFMGPTAGFMFGWAISAFLIGWSVERLWHQLRLWHVIVINIIFGIGIVYIAGIFWLMGNVHFTFMQGLLSCIAYIPGDILKAVLAAFIAVTVKKSYPIIER